MTTSIRCLEPLETTYNEPNTRTSRVTLSVSNVARLVRIEGFIPSSMVLIGNVNEADISIEGYSR